jgi:hypothetical protein
MGIEICLIFRLIFLLLPIEKENKPIFIFSYLKRMSHDGKFAKIITIPFRDRP